MTNIFNTIVSEPEDEFDFVVYLKKVEAYHLFEPIFTDEKFQDITLAVKILKFIAFGFTPDSELLMEKGGTWDKLAKTIFTRVDIPSDLFEEIWHLKNESVRIAIQNWVEFLNDDNWTNYITFRNLRSQMITHSLSDIKKGDELDIKSKMDAAKYAKELLEMMDAIKNNFVQANPKLKVSMEAVKKANVKKETTGPQHYAK